MRRLTAWIGGALGGMTAYRLLRRRSQGVPEPAPAGPDVRADELRAKLAETRAEEPAPGSVVEEPQVEPPAEPVADEGGEEPESPEDRRRRVHEEGRATLDDMKPDGAA